MKARYYGPGSPLDHDVMVEVVGGQLVLTPPLCGPVDVRSVRIESRVGAIPRSIRLPSGAMLETQDHDTLDRWQSELGTSRGLAHRLERGAPVAIGALLLVAALLVGAATRGVPWLSELIAQRLSPEVDRTLGSEALTYLDRSLFEKSALTTAERGELRGLLASVAGDATVSLEFRGGGPLGANAIALPGGTIVVTDELVDLATHDELAAVMLHEVGHVAHRHGLRRVLSHVGLAALSVAVVGDVSSAGTLVLALPNVLLESSYSRAMEAEADGYALARMDALGLPREPFATLLEKLSADGASELGYLSSHPQTADRIARFRAR